MPQTGIGTEFRRWNTSTGIWEKLAEIKSISGPTATRATHDSTTLDTTGGYATFIPGLRDGGTVKFGMNFTRPAYEIMKNDFESDTIQNYEIVLPDVDNTSFEFEGYVTEIPLNIPLEIITCDVSIKISGPVTIDSGSGPSAAA